MKNRSVIKCFQHLKDKHLKSITMKPQKESIFVLLFSIVFCASTAIHNRTVNILHTHFGEICGETFSDRIISGKNAGLGQFPWMARVDVQGEEQIRSLRIK